MSQKKYTLPRHTILAKQSSRLSAFLVDLALGLIITAIFFMGVFRPIFNKRITSYVEILDKEKLNSGLYIKDENGKVSSLDSMAPYQDFLGSLEYFYLHYLTGEDIKEGYEPCVDKYEEFDVAWFNLNVLEIGKKDSENYFEYAKTGEVDDLTKIGVKKEGVSDDIVRVFLSKDKYVAAISIDFANISNVKSTNLEYMFYSVLSFTISSFIAGTIVYIILPLIFKEGRTLGKKIFHLALANADGYRFSNSRLFMRFMPFFIVDLSLLILMQFSLYVVLSIIMVLMLVSFALSMASPKKMALHDLTAQTIVVDLKDSIIFDTIEEEENFILKEDHAFIEEMTINDENGEEPELKYEK